MLSLEKRKVLLPVSTVCQRKSVAVETERAIQHAPSAAQTMSPVSAGGLDKAGIDVRVAPRGLADVSYEVAISHVAIAASFPASSIVQKKATWYHTVLSLPLWGHIPLLVHS